MFWVCKRNVSLSRFFYTPKHMFDRKTLIMLFLCQPPYNFEVKPLVPRTLNLQDSTVYLEAHGLKQHFSLLSVSQRENQ